jgi:hypothetical protein
MFVKTIIRVERRQRRGLLNLTGAAMVMFRMIMVVVVRMIMIMMVVMMVRMVVVMMLVQMRLALRPARVFAEHQ